jgi:Tol biopolymer transport system component
MRRYATCMLRLAFALAGGSGQISIPGQGTVALRAGRPRRDLHQWPAAGAPHRGGNLLVRLWRSPAHRGTALLVPMRRLAAPLAAGMILLGLVASAGPARAVVPGTNGRILFTRSICTSDTRPCWEIVAADANDTHETVLAGPYPRSAWDDHFTANWAPDGRSVIFIANQGIWQVNADGSNLHLVWSPPPDGSGIDDGPTFTPDGNSIIFTRCCPQSSGYGLWRINADGTGLRIVTTETHVDASDNLPQVSPDGTLIAFHRNLNYCGCYIATVNFAGGDLRQLTDPSLNAQIPNWSPDSRRIVFQALGNVWGVNRDGSGLTQLTFDSGKSRSVNPSYSPDGTKIIFVHVRSTGDRDLFTMNPDGSGVTQLTRTANDEWFPQWAVAP